MILLLIACPGSPDDSKAPEETGGDSGDSAEDTDTGSMDAERQLGAASIIVTGMSSSATGQGVVAPGDLDGDGEEDLVVSAYYVDRTCVWRGPVATGEHTLDTADLCWSGEHSYDYSGYAITNAGDLTGDGRPDILIGAIGSDDPGSFAGKVYLVTGDGEGTVALSGAHASWTGEAAADYGGTTLRGIGDATGDGYDDALVASPGADGGKGRVYLIAGPVSAGAASLGDLGWWVTGANGGGTSALMHGETAAGDRLGDGASGGDIDGDGIADVAVGATGSDAAGTDAGSTGIFYGPIDFAPAEFDDADAILTGEAPADFSGGPLVLGGDLDGDGRGDLVIAADGHNSATGRLAIVTAPPFGAAGLADAPIMLDGEVIADEAGKAVDLAGDVNGDGAVDLVVGAPANDYTDVDGGAAYLFLGPLGAGVHLAQDADVRWRAEATGDAAGRAVAGGADLTGDGLDDVLVGAAFSDAGGAFSGRAYVLSY